MGDPSLPIITTTSAAHTAAFGELLGQLAPPNTCIALHGNLGAGETQLTRGIAAGAKVDDLVLVSSPTYVLLNIYPGKKTVYHLDAYRIASEQDFEVVGFDELLQAGGLVVVEWAEKIRHLLPDDRLDLHLDPGESSEERHLKIISRGPRAQTLAHRLAAAWPGQI